MKRSVLADRAFYEAARLGHRFVSGMKMAIQRPIELPDRPGEASRKALLSDCFCRDCGNAKKELRTRPLWVTQRVSGIETKCVRLKRSQSWVMQSMARWVLSAVDFWHVAALSASAAKECKLLA